jgi:hypothetical protein
MVDEVKKRTAWPLIDEFVIKGDYRGRAVTAKHDNSTIDFIISFGTAGQIREFKKI